MVYEVKDKVFFITGAANGIGAGTVKNLLAEGAKHVAILDVATEQGVNLQNELNSKYGDNRTKFYQCDVTNEERLYNVYDEVKKDQGYIDTVINNAGILNDGIPAYKKAIAINVQALISSTYKALELMRKDDGGKGGTIINVSSIAALHSGPGFPVYFTTKSAVLQFTNCLGMEPTYSRTGVRVLTVCFGFTDTTILHSNKFGLFEPEQKKFLMEHLKEARMQKVDSAARGMLEVFKKGESASTWLIDADKPAEDITSSMNEAYKILSRHFTDA
ncbi:hypothetical protein evm_000567 [Chilo suppressalis]|nr:hypothetical protein evm_000567 [Chilo suppressalis]